MLALLMNDVLVARLNVAKWPSARDENIARTKDQDVNRDARDRHDDSIGLSINRMLPGYRMFNSQCKTVTQ